ncbi:MAG: SMP-30/gluconolactonase/LRE family protein, partial [Dehalococcoidia bacterium]|nr:SMP-30/gluconolactonase/LRE family protein [Dehalococcoidia bacterium]
MDFRIVATGLKFPEGPLELPNGDILVTEGIAARLSHARPPTSGEVLFATTGGGGFNGAAVGPDGAIYVAQNGGFHWTERSLPD